MEDKTLFNPLIYTNKVNKSQQLTQIVNFVVDKFCNNMGFNKPYFFTFLPYSDKQLPKYFNPNDDTKSFKLDDLFLILDNLDFQHQKHILDFISQKYNCVCLSNVDTNNNNISLEHLLLNITATDGKLSQKFIDALEDNNIDEHEQNELNLIAYKLRSLLRTFEARINK